MKKIAFVIDTIESPSGGTEKQLLLLIRHLDRSRFTPYLCVLKVSDWLREHFDDCPLVDVNVPTFRRPSSYLNILSFAGFLKKERIDLVQTFFADGNKVGVMAARLSGVRTIISSRRNQGYWHTRLEVLILRVINRWVSRFLANSEDTKRWVEQAEGVDAGRVSVIYNALEIELYGRATEEMRRAFREALGWPPDALIVGVVANLRPVKEIDTFLRAAQMVSQRCSRARFIVVGEGDQRLPLEELCAILQIAPAVRFLGKRLDIPDILGCIDAGVLSSRSESFSNSIVEYLASHLPVVCTDVGGAREVVRDGVNGFVVPSGDYPEMAERLVAILEWPDVPLLRKNSHLAAQRFSLARIVQEHEKFYEEASAL